MPSVMKISKPKPSSLFGFECLSQCAVQTPDATRSEVIRRGATPLGSDENDSSTANNLLDDINVEVEPPLSSRRLLFLGPDSPEEVTAVEIQCVQIPRDLPLVEGGTPRDVAPFSVAGVTAVFKDSVTAFSTHEGYWCKAELVAVSEDNSRCVVRFMDYTEEWAALPSQVYWGTVGSKEIKRATAAAKASA